MKKDYEAPQAEKIEFNYEDTVVASGTVKQYAAGKKCTVYNNNGMDECK